MIITTRHMATTLVAATATTLALIPAVQATEIAEARSCIDADNVWVYVEYGGDSTKDPKGACATEFSNGLEALDSAGFDITYSESDFGRFVTGIDGVAPVWSQESPLYWSYWDGAVADDYTVTYEAYMVGGSASVPEPGSVEAWSVGDGSVAPALTQLPEAAKDGSAAGSSETGLLAGLFGLLGGVFTALQSGLLAVLGLFTSQS